MESTSKEVASILSSSQERGKDTIAWRNDNNKNISNNYSI
jgi:hypothetical protein